MYGCILPGDRCMLTGPLQLRCDACDAWVSVFQASTIDLQCVPLLASPKKYCSELDKAETTARPAGSLPVRRCRPSSVIPIFAVDPRFQPPSPRSPLWESHPPLPDPLSTLSKSFGGFSACFSPALTPSFPSCARLF